MATSCDVLGVEETYCINLARRADRLAQARGQFARVGLDDVSFFPAFDAARLNLAHAERAAGEIGCYLSHLALLKAARARGLRSLALVEDDVVFHDGFAEAYAAFRAHVPDDWDVLYLGGWHVEPPTPVNERVTRLVKTYGTTLVIFHGRSLDVLLEHADDLRDQIDVYYHHAMARLRFYCPPRAIVSQSPGWSDIRESMCTNDHIR